MTRVWIISYFGEKDRERRVENHNKQLDFWLQLGYEVVVLAMEYQEDDYRDDTEIDYHIHDLLHPPQARNVLKEIFYESRDPWAIFVDNDTIIHPYGNWNWGTFRRITDDYREHVHLWKPINPLVQPFKKEVDFTNEEWPGQLYFVKDLLLKGSIYAIQNFARHPDIKRAIFYGDSRYAEDMTFPLEMARYGLGSYQCKNVALREFPAKSTFIERAPIETDRRDFLNRNCLQWVHDNMSDVVTVDMKKLRINRRHTPFPHPSHVLMDINGNWLDNTEWHRHHWMPKVYREEVSAKRTIF